MLHFRQSRKHKTKLSESRAIIQCTFLLIIIFNTLVNHLSDFTITLKYFTTRHIKIHLAFNSLRVSAHAWKYLTEIVLLALILAIFITCEAVIGHWQPNHRYSTLGIFYFLFTYQLASL